MQERTGSGERDPARAHLAEQPESLCDAVTELGVPVGPQRDEGALVGTAEHLQHPPQRIAARLDSPLQAAAPRRGWGQAESLGTFEHGGGG